MPDGHPLADPVERALSACLDGMAPSPARTKRSAVRLAIARAMRDGVLKNGDMLPPERRLAEIFGVSVGTVQAALQQLQQRGEIVRRSGYGTRVVLDDSFSSAIWHFRIVDCASGRPGSARPDSAGSIRRRRSPFSARATAMSASAAP